MLVRGVPCPPTGVELPVGVLAPKCQLLFCGVGLRPQRSGAISRNGHGAPGEPTPPADAAEGWGRLWDWAGWLPAGMNPRGCLAVPALAPKLDAFAGYPPDGLASTTRPGVCTREDGSGVLFREVPQAVGGDCMQKGGLAAGEICGPSPQLPNETKLPRPGPKLRCVPRVARGVARPPMGVQLPLGVLALSCQVLTLCGVGLRPRPSARRVAVVPRSSRGRGTVGEAKPGPETLDGWHRVGIWAALRPAGGVSPTGGGSIPTPVATADALFGKAGDAVPSTNRRGVCTREDGSGVLFRDEARPMDN